MRIDNKLFNPANQPKEWLIENFVVRTKVFEKIFKDIQSGEMKYPEQHYLIQGLRGMGKTTLLLRLKYEVEKNKVLNNWLIPIFFNEESYDLSSLSNLWEKLLKYLDEYFETGSTLYDSTEKFMGSKDYEKQCLDFLLQTLTERKKKLLILFDNFGELFLDNLSEKETHRLREILMNCSDMRIVAASAIVLEDQHDYSKPFFEFFKIIYLDGLNKDETLDLITKLQEKETRKIDIEKNKAKIETLALLTGGVIRTILLLYEVLLSDENGTALRDLDIILDRITPLYKHRMEVLSVQQRKIVDVVAKSWDAISVKDIAGKIRENGNLMQGKAISAQLAQLEKNNVIEKKETTTKNNFYQLKERFFNIWYLMRNGSHHDKCRVIWLTRFLEIWYSEEQHGTKSFIKTQISRLKKGNYYPESALLVLQAVFSSEKITIEEKEKLLKETKRIMPKTLLEKLPKIEDTYREEMRRFLENGEFFKAYKLLNQSFKTKEYNLLEPGISCHFRRERLDNKLKSKFSDDIKSTDRSITFLLMTISAFGADYKKMDQYLTKHYKVGKNSVLYLEGLLWQSLNHEENALKIYLQDFNNKQSLTREKSGYKLAANYLKEKINKEIALEYTDIPIDEINKQILHELGITFEYENNEEKVTKILILLWNNRISQALEYLSLLLTKEGLEHLKIDILIRFLIAKKQHHTALNLFNERKYELRDKYKPLYYALMHFMKDEYPNEYLKMGSELDPAVKEIITNITQIAIDYA